VVFSERYWMSWVSINEIGGIRKEDDYLKMGTWKMMIKKYIEKAMEQMRVAHLLELEEAMAAKSLTGPSVLKGPQNM